MKSQCIITFTRIVALKRICNQFLSLLLRNAVLWWWHSAPKVFRNSSKYIVHFLRYFPHKRLNLLYPGFVIRCLLLRRIYLWLETRMLGSSKEETRIFGNSKPNPNLSISEQQKRIEIFFTHTELHGTYTRSIGTLRSWVREAYVFWSLRMWEEWVFWLPQSLVKLSLL